MENTRPNSETIKISDEDASERQSAKPKINMDIYVTSSAVAEVLRRISLEPGGEKKMLRLKVEAGGCSGLSYEMDFVSEKGRLDREFEFEGLKVLVDAKSLLYIGGMTLDYSTKMVNGGFQFTNPRAKRSCGCGTSFSV